MLSTRRFLIGCLALAAALACPPASSAQQQLGAIQGTIVDGSRAVMPGVSVTVTNLGTGVSRTAVTNETGVYRVLSLDPGRCKITAELQGFRTAAQNEVIVSVGATLGVNFTLEPGGIEEAIEVRATPPDIQTERPRSPPSSSRRRSTTCRSSDATSWRSRRCNRASTAFRARPTS